MTADCGIATTNLLTDVSKTNGIEGEPAIAINPADPQNLFMVANNGMPSQTTVCRSSSTDGGATWSGFTPFSNSHADPSAAFDSFGNLFVSFLQPDLSVVVLLSTNKGGTFTTSKTYHSSTGTNAYDHPELTTGPGGVWVTFYDLVANHSVVAGAAVTSLGGVGTWPATPTAIGNTTADPGAQSGYGYGWGDVAVGPTGQVAVVVVSGASGPSQIRVSTNPSGTNQPSNFSSALNVVSTQVGFLQSIPAQPDQKITPTPGLAWDRTGGQYRGRLYMVYTDHPVGEATNTDIYVMYSTNNGASWTGTVKINSDSTKNSQFFPKIALDQTSGKLAVSWYDCRADSNNRQTQFYCAVSSDGGSTFSSSNLKLESPNSSDASLLNANDCFLLSYPAQVDYYDYTGLAFYGGYFYSAWADNSTNAPGNPDATCGMDIIVAKIKY
jgi:hypothetical protein